MYHRVAKASQRYVKAFEQKDKASLEGGTTEFAELETVLEAAEKALREDLVELAQQAMAAAKAQLTGLNERKRVLKAERGDVEFRRKQLADLAAGYDWSMVHKDKRDFIGPFTIEHEPPASILKLGNCKLKALDYPSGEELFAAVKAERARLEVEARQLWPVMKELLLPLQKGPEASVPWAGLVNALSTPELPFRRREPAVLFALALLRAGQLEGLWSIVTRQPTLAQQNSKESVSLPRVDKPGNSDKVFSIRFEPPR